MTWQNRGLWTIAKLQGREDYPTWSEKLMACLKVDGLAIHVQEGAESVAAQAVDKAAWQVKDDQAHSRILLSVQDNLIAVIRRMTARQAWLKLQQNVRESQRQQCGNNHNGLPQQ